MIPGGIDGKGDDDVDDSSIGSGICYGIKSLLIISRLQDLCKELNETRPARYNSYNTAARPHHE